MKIRKALKARGGFTLIEMLIVVAIIAILVAVSIPMVTKNLDKTKEATDSANLRSAKAAAVLKYMEEETLTANYYNLDEGAMTTEAQSAQGQASDHKSQRIKVTDESGVIKATWENVDS